MAFEPDVRFAVALSADFEPEDFPGLIELHYLVQPGGQLGAGLFEIRFVRTLEKGETVAEALSKAGAPQ